MDVTGALWTVARVLATTAALYIYIVGLLRITGNRTLAKLRAFDLVVTIAIGGVVATSVVDGTPSALLRGATAITALVLLQWVVAFFSVRSERVNHLVTSPPTLLFYDGKYLGKALQAARVTRNELQLRMRREGIQDERDVLLALLEPNGEITLLRKDVQQIPLDSESSSVRGALGAGEVTESETGEN